MRLQDENEHPHGLSDREFDMIFTTDKPVIFAYHGYPWLIHRLTYRRTGNDNLHVRGYKEEGTTTTPFDMVMLNDLDRYHLVIDVIDRVPFLQSACATLRQEMVDKRLAAREYTREHGDDIPEVRDWVWPDARDAGRDARRSTPPRRPAATTSSGAGGMSHAATCADASTRRYNSEQLCPSPARSPHHRAARCRRRIRLGSATGRAAPLPRLRRHRDRRGRAGA